MTRDVDTYWTIAERVCTLKQLRILELRERHHFSLRQISYTTGLSLSAVRGHLDAAHRNINACTDKEPA